MTMNILCTNMEKTMKYMQKNNIMGNMTDICSTLNIRVMKNMENIRDIRTTMQ